jgi:hypothetical protein
MAVMALDVRGRGRRTRRVSLPTITALADDARYQPSAPPPPRERAPSIRRLVKLDRKSSTIEELAEALRLRYARQAAGVADARLDDDEDRRLDQLERRLLGG